MKPFWLTILDIVDLGIVKLLYLYCLSGWGKFYYYKEQVCILSAMRWGTSCTQASHTAFITAVEKKRGCKNLKLRDVGRPGYGASTLLLTVYSFLSADIQCSEHHSTMYCTEPPDLQVPECPSLHTDTTSQGTTNSAVTVEFMLLACSMSMILISEAVLLHVHV